MSHLAATVSRIAGRAGLRPRLGLLTMLVGLLTRLAVVGCVTVALGSAFVRLDDVLGLYDTRADTNADFTYAERAHTHEGWGPASGTVLEDARLWMPEEATYRVVFGPEFDHARSPDITRYLLLWFLLPRTPTESTSAEWLFCYGCDEQTFGERFQVLSRAEGGPWFGRMLR